MRLGSGRRGNRAAIAVAATIVGLLSCALPVSAQEHLGPIDNVLLKNPYADAANGQFGRGVVAGDFDDDGVGDLAVSENGSDRLRVYRGVAFTVGTSPAFSFFATTVTMPTHNYAMAAGDFDNDGRDEIAVSASGTSVSGLPSAGRVYVMDRASNGAWSVQSTIQAGGGYPGAPQTGANLGNSLTTGDFDNDGYADLAIGIRGQTVGGVENAGAILITYGSAQGITATGARIINRNSDGLTFTPVDNDYFGWSLAAGDFDGDEDDDLAVGVLNGTCPNGTDRGGAVVVLNGSPTNGITNAGSRIWRPGVQGIAGDCAAADGFGTSLAAGHFTSTGFGSTPSEDLAIGATGGSAAAGAVHILYGTGTGLDADNNQRLLPPALPGIISGDGRFGSEVAAGTLARNCFGLSCDGNSLAVSAPFATVNGTDNAGVVWVFDPGDGDRIDAGTARPILPLAPLNIAGPHANDQFGNDLAIGDFNDDNRADLAVGTYLYDDGGDTDSGAVQVLYQTDLLFVDGFDD